METKLNFDLRLGVGVGVGSDVSSRRANGFISAGESAQTSAGAGRYAPDASDTEMEPELIVGLEGGQITSDFFHLFLQAFPAGLETKAGEFQLVSEPKKHQNEIRFVSDDHSTAILTWRKETEKNERYSETTGLYLIYTFIKMLLNILTMRLSSPCRI